jgi:anti-sigma B factor antagonist
MPDYSQCQDLLPDCTVDETWTGRTVVLSVSGSLDMLTSPNLEIAVDSALSKGPSALIVDLTDVDFLASHGMGVLVATHHRVGADVAYLVVADGPATARPLTLIGISEIIDIYPTLSQALVGLAA